MKDIFRLLKAQKNIYLIILLITLLITLCGSINYFSIYTNHDLINNSSVTQKQLCDVLTYQPRIFEFGINNGAILKSFWEGNTLFCSIIAHIIMISCIFLCHLGMNQRRAKEFWESLPVKKVSLELFAYIGMVIILCANFATGAIVGIISLTASNKAVLHLKEQFPSLLTHIPSDLIMQGNLNFLWQLGNVFLSFLFTMTFLYLCGNIFKNRIIGIIAGLLLLYNHAFIYSLLFALDLPPMHWLQIATEIFLDLEPHFIAPVSTISALIMIPLIITLIVKAVSILLMVAAIIWHAKRRELSEGKLLYLNSLQIAFLVLAGLHILISLPFPVSVIVTVLAEALAIFFLYTKKRKLLKLAVTEKIVCTNPVQKNGFTYYVISGFVISLLCFLYGNHTLSIEFDYFKKGWIVVDESFYHLSAHALLPLGYIMLFGLLIAEGIQLIKLQSSASRLFLETLPVTKTKRYITGILLNFLCLVLPLITCCFLNIYYRIEFHRYLENIAILDIKELFWFIAFVIYMALFFTGLLKFADAVAVNAVIKIVFLITSIITYYLVFVACAEFFRPLLFFFEIFTWSGALTHSLIGILLLILAGYLTKTRLAEKKLFYFSFAKHIFAAQLSFIFLSFAGFTDKLSVFTILAPITGSILLYALTIYLCNTNRIKKHKR